MPLRRKSLDCDDCGDSTFLEYYMLRDALWHQYAGDAWMLCVGCFEARLGWFPDGTDETGVVTGLDVPEQLLLRRRLWEVDHPPVENEADTVPDRTAYAIKELEGGLVP